MARLLKQSTTVTVRLGPALDKTDGVTEETALSPTVEISKNNGAFAARNSATAITHDSNGWYAVELNTTDTGTLGPLVAKFDDAATHLPVWHPFWVVPSNVYDSFHSTDILDVSVTQWLGTAAATPTVAGVPEVDVTHVGGDAQSATDLKDFADAGYDPATNKVQGVVLTDTVTTLTGHTAQTGDAFARLGAPAGASVSADVAAVKAETASILTDTAEIGAAGAGLTALATAAALATVDTNVDAILVDTGTTLPAEHDATQALIAALNDITVTEILDAANAIETGVTPRGALRLILAVLAGKVSGAGTGTEVFRNAVADLKARLTVTADVDGNRTAITYDQT